MEISSSVPFDVDESAEEALEKAQALGKPLKIRIAPTLWVEAAGQAGPWTKGSYVSWKKVVWNLQTTTMDEIQGLRTGLQLFFRAAHTFGMLAVVERLQKMLREAPERDVPAQDEDE